MKKTFLPGLLCMLFLSTAAQPKAELFRFEHTGARAAIIKQNKLSHAKLLSDLLPYFPSKDKKKLIVYHSVVFTSVHHGSNVSASGVTEELTAEQLQLLSNAEIGEEILVTVGYSYKNSENEQVVAGREFKEIEFAVTPGPDTEAQFPGGKEAMEMYITANITGMIPDKAKEEKIAKATVHYTVDEEGKIVAPMIYKTSLDPEIDKLLIEAISKMPRWKPAQNSKGENVKQDFIVNVCNTKAGC